MPTLNWIGKDKVVTHHQDVPFRVLDKKYTFGDTPDSGNMIIHGDNLEALKALLPEYEGRIKCIYIDPPYNTGNEGWVYNDNVSDPRIRKWLGQVVGSEVDDLTRHDKWLCMMYPRLKLLHRLLAEDGIIFISIDDNEESNLKCICNEIFGASNFVSRIIWHNNKKGRQMDKYIKTTCEYVLVYAKKKDNLRLNEKTIGVKTDSYEYSDEISRYKKGYPLHNGTAAFHIENRPNLCYSIYYNPQTKDIRTIDEKVGERGNYRLELSSEGNELLSIGYVRIVPKRNEKYNTQRVWRWGQEKVNRESRELMFTEEEAGWYIYQKERMTDDGTKTVKFTNYFDVDTSRGRNTMNEMFGNVTVFDFPKPTELIEYLFSMVSSADIVLDSFAGSGTTAHAVLNMNKQDGAKRKFILCEMGDYAEAVTAERVKRAIAGYGDSANRTEGTGGSFSFYELGETIFDPKTGLLNNDAEVEQIRRYVWYTETHTSYKEDEKRSNPYLLGTHNFSDYYFYYEPQEETVLDWEFLCKIKQRAEQYIIFADRCLLADEELQKHNIVFKKIPRDIKRQ